MCPLVVVGKGGFGKRSILAQIRRGRMGRVGDRFHTWLEQALAPLMMTPLFWANIQKLVLGVAVLAMLAAAAIYLNGKIRAKAAQKEPTANELLTKFREMHSRGVLSDEEFRTIKTTLKERLQAELKAKDETG